MAGDRGRDLKVGIVVDASEAEKGLRDAAEGFADVADAGADAARAVDKVQDAARGNDLKRAGADAKDAAKDVDRFGDQAKATAVKVDNAYEAIARSSKARLGQGTKDAAREAEQGLGEFKDEANSTAREAAASFDGSAESIVDAFQETAANAFAGFGPAGAAAGLLAAAGLGSAMSALQGIADEVNAAKEKVNDLASAMIDAGGSLDAETVTERIRAWADEIVDTRSWFEVWQESARDNFDVVRDAAKDTGIGVRDMLRAMSGLDADAARDVLSRLREQIVQLRQEQAAGSAYDDVGNAVIGQQITARQDLIDKIQAQIDITGSATEKARDEAAALGGNVEAQKAAAKAVEEHTAAVDGLSGSVDAFADPVAAYTQALADKKAAEKDSSKTTQVTVDEYLTQLRKQVEAQESWAGNLQTLARRGVDEGVLAQLARMGPEGAPLVAQLATASDGKLAELVGLMGRQGKASADALATNLGGGVPYIKEEAGKLVQAVRDSVTGQDITLPVKVQLDAAQYNAQLAAIRKQAVLERVMP